MKFDSYKWHSINIIPTINIYPSSNSKFGSALEVTEMKLETVLEVTIFGRVFRIVVPGYNPKLAHTFLEISGPIWSRKQKHWYWAPCKKCGYQSQTIHKHTKNECIINSVLKL